MSAAEPKQELHKEDIAKVLSSKGPVVKCVLLKHMRPDGKDTKPHVIAKSDETHKRQVLTELIEEIEIDTTPSKSEVKNVLGGPFTFLGQYPSEGTMVMARQEMPDDLESLSVHALRELCIDNKIDTTGMLEKQELVAALQNAQLPVNPHKLQPPLDGVVVRGDILLMKVAETEEVLDEADGDKELQMLSNEEFFLDYTMEEYIAFASRTDVVAPEPPEEEEEEEEEDDDEDDEDYKAEDDIQPDEEGTEEERCGILNLVFGEVLKKFREENGRGPDTRELLELRSKVAEQLGVEVATVNSDDEEDKKRPAEKADGDHAPKKVKFSPGTIADGEQKQAAAEEGCTNGEEKKT